MSTSSSSKIIVLPDADLTITKLNKVQFSWTINDIKSLERNMFYQSSEFDNGSNSNIIKWCLCLQVKAVPNNHYSGYTGNLSEISLKMASKPSDGKEVPCTYTFSILNSNHKAMRNYSKCNHNFSSSSPMGPFVSLYHSGEIPFYRNVRINCDLEFVTKVFKHSTTHLNANDRYIANNFANLLQSQIFSDVKLVVGEQEFPAHKNILAARSEVFAAMFQHEMQENKSGKVVIEDASPEVVKEMLFYIYTGESPNIKNLADDLLVIANKYALKHLQVKAEFALSSLLTVDTAIERLILADQNNAEILKKATIELINNTKDFIRTDGWKKKLISHPDLILDIYEELVKSNEVRIT